MTNYQEVRLTESLRGQCQLWFKNNFQKNKFIYSEYIPFTCFGREYTIELVETSLKFDWIGEAKLEIKRLPNNDIHNQYKFKQSCRIKYKFKLDSVLDETEHIKEVYFHNEVFEPFDNDAHIQIEIKELAVFDELRNFRARTKARYAIESINEIQHENSFSASDLFRQILTESQKNITSPLEINTKYFYHEFFYCLWEIEECLLTALFHHQYTSDLLARKEEGAVRDLYIPNFNYNDSQYLLMIGFGFDRLYSFWDRITFLLASFVPIGFKLEYLSFDKYLEKIKNKIPNGGSVFNSNSIHLNWLIDFYNTSYPDIERYRHRNVHFKITNDWQGLLSSKFSTNAIVNSSSEAQLKKMKLEFEGLGNLLLKHFNLCKQGFIETLKLIDELPK